MSAGTLTLTNNSAVVAGNGTAFTTEVAAGDFIVVTVGGVPYTLPIKSVESGTALTLVSNFTGPTQAGAAWSAVPRVALNMVTAALVAQSAEALRGLNYDKQNWQQVFSAPGMINVKLPDGSSFPGPSWKYLADQVENIDGDTLKRSKNFSDVVDKAQSRSSLGLKALAVKSTVELSGDDTTGILPLSKGGSGFGTTAGLRQAAVVHGVDGAFGSINNILTYFNTAASNAGVFSFRDIAGDATATYQWSASVLHRTSDTYSIFSVNHANGNVKVASGSVSGGIASTFNQNTLWGTRNTTVDGNGFIKQASPVVIIHREGSYETNHESEGCAVERISVGEYLITGCIGLNADAAWGGIDGGFEIPVDRNKQPRIWLDYKVNADGSVLVRTYHRIHPSAPPFAQNRIGNTDNNGVFTETVADGEPVDIPADSFVSVRVEMPEDSIWNRMQKETCEAIEKAERERQQDQQDTQL
ncbi:phage tail protein [Citrobacter freundii]|nr:phage tail protein [Citrobacter freundii]